MIEGEQEHRRSDDRDNGDGQVEALENTKRPSGSCSVASGKRQDPGIRVHVSGKLPGIARIDQRDVDGSHILGAREDAVRPRHVQQIRQVQSHRSRDLPQPRRIGCGLVDTHDPELASVGTWASGASRITLPTRKPSDSASWRDTSRQGAWSGGRGEGWNQPQERGDERRWNAGPHHRLRASIRSHSASVTGMTESLAMRTSGKNAKVLSDLIRPG